MRKRLQIALKVGITTALCLAIVPPASAPANERLKLRAQVSSLLRETQEHLAAGAHDSALASIGQIREVDPNNQDAFYLEAVTHLARSDTAQAVAVMAEGMKRAPLSSRLKLLRVRIHLAGQEYEQADVLLAAVFRFKPNNAEASFLSGLSSLARGDTTRTIEVWEEALERLQQKGRIR
jgi:Flp pilus assembly protein TadD